MDRAWLTASAPPDIVPGDVRQLGEWIEDSLYRCRIDVDEVLRRADLPDRYLAKVEEVGGRWEVDEQFFLRARWQR